MTISMPRLDRLPAQERGLTIGDFLVPIRVSERLNTRAGHLALSLIEWHRFAGGDVLAEARTVVDRLGAHGLASLIGGEAIVS